MNLGAIFVIIVVIVSIVRGVAAMLGEDSKKPGKGSAGRPIEDWHQQERRDGGDANTHASAQGAQLTMAERIEIARQQARERAGVDTTDPAEALRQARARAEAEARRRQEVAARREAAAMEDLERKRVQQDRQRRADARRQAEQRAEVERAEQRKSRSQRRASRSKQATITDQPSSIAAREAKMRAESKQRVHEGQVQALQQGIAQTRHAGKAGALIGPLDKDSLRRAFILKEMLDKPLALRSSQDDLLS